MTSKEMMAIVTNQLATDLNCKVEDFNSDEIFVFCDAKDNVGRRPFPREKDHFEMVTMGKSTIVSATKDLLQYIKKELDGKKRDEAFCMPFVHGQGIYYLPDLNVMKPMTAPSGYDFELYEADRIPELYDTEGFRYAIQYDVNHPRPDALALIARQNGKIVGIAGSSNDCEKMWQIGIDVLAECRGSGVAAYIVNTLSLEILSRGYIPYYGTSSANIGSQRVAHKIGYAPAWTCVYRGRFDKYMTSPTG